MFISQQDYLPLGTVRGALAYPFQPSQCGLAPTAAIRNISRAFQGIGAGIQLSAALAVFGHEFQGSERARAFGFWGTVLGVAVTAGAFVGTHRCINFEEPGTDCARGD